MCKPLTPEEAAKLAQQEAAALPNTSIAEEFAKQAKLVAQQEADIRLAATRPYTSFAEEFAKQAKLVAQYEADTYQRLAKLAQQEADDHVASITGLFKPFTPEELAKRTQQQVDALLREADLQRLHTQQQVDALLCAAGLDMDRTKGLNVDRTKVADDGSREED
jgi:hypothetical protein